ncbi:hypothetical protein ACQPYK_32990 [Streptosporangium sp. CA-135522]|uniref:hypothetical protein n=1 Tax=Streptosporangium sp. CA-135522 TaxID=3240072 RepID=UPI003D8ED335
MPMLDTAASATLLWRRDRPFTVLTFTLACHLVAAVIGQVPWTGVAATCALCSVGRCGTPRRARIAAIAVDVAVAAQRQLGVRDQAVVTGQDRVPGEAESTAEPLDQAGASLYPMIG